MHLICATHAHIHLQCFISFIRVNILTAHCLTDECEPHCCGRLYVCACVCLWVKTKINGLVYSQSPSPSLSLSLSALRLHSNRMPQSSREAAAACAAEGACPNAINARCTYATNVINLQARKRDRPRERERETELQHFVACCS